MKTRVEVTCIAKKQTQNYGSNHKENPLQTEISFSVPYDPNNVYYQMSGGSAPVFYTVNQDVADMFTIGGKYAIEITPVEPAIAPTEMP